MPEDEQPRSFGRTIWDVLAEGKRTILTIIILVVVVGALIYCFINLRKELFDFLNEYKYMIIAPVIGWMLGSYVVGSLYQTNRRLVICIDPSTHMARAVSIPEKLYSNMKQAGNNVVYHTPYGTPTYFVNSLDLDSGDINYGWLHELNAAVVMTREDAFVKWNELLGEVYKENLELRSYPHVMAFGIARKALKEYLDRFGEILGFGDKDLDPHRETEQKKMGDENKQEFNSSEGGDEFDP